MDQEKKIDVLDLIINTLTEHEKKLSETIDRLNPEYENEKITVKRFGTSNYMIVKVEDDETVFEYLTKIIETEARDKR